MNIFKSLQSKFSSSNSPKAHINFAEKLNGKKSVLTELKTKTEYLTKKDVGTWHKAWQMAINTEEPKRSLLYDVYSNVLIDNHLSGCIEQRKGKVLSRNFVIIDKSGKENQVATKIFENQWFRQFQNLALDARLFGHSLIQLGDVVKGDIMSFSDVSLVNRKHVVPEFGVFLIEQDDDIKKGLDYRYGEFADWTIEVGEPYDLGLLLKVAPQALSKKNMLAYWDVFGEIFGMPLRWAQPPSQDSKDWERISSMLDDMGAAGWALVPEGTTIEIKETSRSDAFNVYDKRIERCNSEISKVILGQTMTIDSGASLSQSQTHLEVLDNICQADAQMLKYVINNKLIPLMEKHGFPVSGCIFEWDNALEFSPAEQREMERLLLQEYDIDPQYFIDKYKIPIVGKKQSSETKESLKSPDDFFA